MIYSILIWLSAFSPIHEGNLVGNLTVSIYPNPSEGRFQVEVRGATNEIILRLYNMKGEIFEEHRLEKIPVYTTLSLGNDNLENGIYSLVVTCSNGQQRVERILIYRD